MRCCRRGSQGMAEALVAYGPSLGEVVVRRDDVGFGLSRRRTVWDSQIPAWVRYFTNRDNLCGVCKYAVDQELASWLCHGLQVL